MKSILISIRPEWTAKILNGEKTIEVRKTAPKCELPVDVYIYCTKGDYIGCISNKYVGKVVAKFTLKEVEGIMYLPQSIGLDERRKRGCCSFVFKDSDKPNYDKEDYSDYFTEGSDDNYLVFFSKIKASQIHAYLRGRNGYAWRISDLQIFDEPKDLSEFGLTRAPQSWCYCEVKE